MHTVVALLHSLNGLLLPAGVVACTCRLLKDQKNVQLISTTTTQEVHLQKHNIAYSAKISNFKLVLPYIYKISLIFITYLYYYITAACGIFLYIYYL